MNNQKVKKEIIKEEESKYCIFEGRHCIFANKQQNLFECLASSDEEMTCRK